MTAASKPRDPKREGAPECIPVIRPSTPASSPDAGAAFGSGSTMLLITPAFVAARAADSRLVASTYSVTSCPESALAPVMRQRVGPLCCSLIGAIMPATRSLGKCAASLRFGAGSGRQVCG
ncbi:MAG TPA: hypothetical protein VFB66_25640 [Tepidisphaeraceae bacterium]|nr:hypothetical protein [Tepidisphaeraceae bacterium]